ncbi:hypothetical protein SEA_MAZUN_54 [Microbacterium phage Mazun]|nr:hypothetical protein SEA_MAZUN_54 [Microbacterium phage Mazun]
MRFTRRTYRAAIRRAREREIYFWRGHAHSFCGPEKLYAAYWFTNKLKARQRRECK